MFFCLLLQLKFLLTNPCLHITAPLTQAAEKRSRQRKAAIRYMKWGGLQMNLDATQERYLFVNFYGLRVTFPTSYICVTLYIILCF